MKRRRRFYQTIQSQILVWAGEKSEQIGYDGEMIHVPGRNEIAAAEDPSSRYRYDSATTTAGHPIPGTLKLTDGFRRTPEGGKEKIFDVALFCQYLERDRQDLIMRGLEIVTDANDCGAAMDESKPRYEDSMDDRARRIIVDELERRKKIEERGGQVFRSSSETDVVWAHAHMQRRGPMELPTVTTEDLRGVMLGIAPAASDQADTMATEPIPKSAEELYDVTPPPTLSTEELKPAAPKMDSGSLVMQLHRTAKALGVKLSAKERERLMDNDQDTLELVAEKLSVARQEKEQGAAAPA